MTILFYLPESIATPHVEVSGSSLLLRARLPAGNGGERAHCGIRVFAGGAARGGRVGRTP
ncbi:MAG: hypothetical protein KF901_31540 [Myxococcales bacterium]|nr:hypothetical protein [Myxococcales bacterium]